MTEDEMAGWHHWLDGHESEWTPGVGDGQGGLVCCDSWGRKECDMTEWLIWSELYHNYFHFSHSDGCVMILLGTFNLHFSEDWRCRVLFIFLLTIKITSFVQSPFRSIAYNISCLCYWNMLNKFWATWGLDSNKNLYLVMPGLGH